jgi:hypothetical protein
VLGALLGVSAACSDRDEAAEIREVCEDSCRSSFACGLDPASDTQEGCVADCVPILSEQRALCEPYFELKACLAYLSCEEYATYAYVVDNANGTVIHEAVYPCKEEVLRDLKDCT